MKILKMEEFLKLSNEQKAEFCRLILEKKAKIEEKIGKSTAVYRNIEALRSNEEVI